MTFDPSDDFADVTDGLQSVTVRRPGSSQSTEVTHALCRAIRTREAEESDGRYTASDVAWHLPASELADPPRPGDVITDASSQRWNVLDVQRTTLQNRWRCVSRNLAVVHGLDQYVDVQKATYSKGAGGADEPAWHTWRTGLAARIQPAGANVTNQHERRLTAADFTVFVAEDVPLDHTHRIIGPDGTVYRVLGYRKNERVDALMEIDVARVS